MKKGFTLIELLAVIATMAILVILVVPNILKLMDKSKKNLFVIQAKNIYKEALREQALATMENEVKNRFYYDEEAEENKLNLSGNKSIFYDIEMDNDKVTKFSTWNKNYIIELMSSDIKLEDISLDAVLANNGLPTDKKYVTDISSSNHTLFLLNDKSVKTSGNNYYNQLGAGIDGGNKSYPVQVKKDLSNNLTNVKAISAGSDHTVFLLEDGTAWSIGYNYYGQLGDGTTGNKSYAVQVKKDENTNLTNVKAISARNYYTVFLLEDGTVWSVGANTKGQLGDGTTTNRSYPVQVKKDENTNLTNVKAISAGNDHTIFLLEDGTVWSVGTNSQGELGDGTTANKSYPVQVMKTDGTSLSNVKAISAGENHTIFLLEDGTVWATGNNAAGQLGDRTTTNKSYPVQAMKDESTNLTNVKAISAGNFYTVFLLEDGTAWSVGDNYYGRLGDGTTSNSNYLVQVKKDASTNLTNIKSIFAKNEYTVFLLEDGTVWSVGRNSNGQLGDGTIIDKSYLIQVKKDENSNLTNVKAISAGNNHTTFLLEDGTVWSVGSNFNGQLGNSASYINLPIIAKKDANTNLTNVKAVCARNNYSVFLLENGTVWVVGSNTYVQLGDGTTTNKIYPEQVKKDENTGLTNVKAISAGDYHIVFLLEDGTVWSVGTNSYGQLGDGTITNKGYAVQVKKDDSTFLTNVKAISAGTSHTIFLLEDGTVWSVGRNLGQLGDGTNTNRSYPVQVKKDASTNLTNVKAISAGASHTIFLLEDGTAWSVGRNSFGQLGDGTITNRNYTVQVKKDASTNLTNVKAISTVSNHTIFLLENGTAWSVGYNSYGQLGDGTTANKSYPVQVKKNESTDLTNIKVISAGSNHVIFLLEDQTMWSVGHNSYGQLGDGTTTNRSYAIKSEF